MIPDGSGPIPSKTILIKMLFLQLQEEPLFYIKAVQYCALLWVKPYSKLHWGQTGIQLQTALKVNEKSAWYMQNYKKKTVEEKK